MNIFTWVYGGDQTQNILWRVRNGEIPRYSKHAIVSCGGNNIGKDTPDEIANAIIVIGNEN